MSDTLGFDYERRGDDDTGSLPTDVQAALLDDLRSGLSDPTELGSGQTVVNKGIGKTILDDMAVEDGQI